MNTKELQSHFQKWLFEHSNIYQCLNYSKTYYECDILGITKSMISTEIEVKVSIEDFKADFNKLSKHYLLSEGCHTSIRHIPNKFYYGCESGLIDIKLVPKYAGLLYSDTGGNITIIKNAPILHKIKTKDNTVLSMMQLNTERNIFGCSFLTHKNRLTKADLMEYKNKYNDL